MLKTHRIALVTNNREATLLARHAGFARFAYNSALADFKEGLDRREWLGERTLRPRFNALKESVAPWSTDLAQNAGKYAIIDLGQVCGPLGGVPQGEEGVGRRGQGRRDAQAPACVLPQVPLERNCLPEGGPLVPLRWIRA